MESSRYLFLAIFLMATIGHAEVNGYFSSRMNFYSQQLHVQTINFSGNLSVTAPANFTIYNYTGGATNASGIISWSSNSSIIVNYTLQSPSSCNEGARYFSNISADGFHAQFTFVCVPDGKIVDYKAEYGHGDANYLTENYISNETATLFNLIRVFNIGNFLEPNENAYNATINCTFPNMPVRTYGRAEVTRDKNVHGSFFWERVEDGYWFRIGVLSQDIEQKPVGYTYNVSCTSLGYDFSHHHVTASFENKSLEVRSKLPFNISVTDNLNYLTYTIKNSEKYPVKNIVFKWNINNLTRTEEMNIMQPNDTIRFDIFLEGSGTINFRADFVPSWFANSRNPVTYTQIRNDLYNIDTRPALITNLNIALLRAVNQTTSDARNSQQKNFRAELSDFDAITGSQVYRARLNIYDFEGKPANASSTPRILIYDPLRNLIVNSTMNFAEQGIYTYNYTTSQSQTTGVYETIAEVNVSDTVAKPSDFWQMANSPAQVKLNNILDNTAPTITFDAIIENEGSADAEYQYEYCIVVNETNQCGGNDDVDYASAAKLVKRAERFSPLLTLKVPAPGEYFFKLVVYFGTESSGSAKKFTAVEAETQTAGGARSSFDVDLSTAQSVSVQLQENSIKTLTFDRYSYHTIVVDTITANSVVITIRSVPVTISLSVGESKNVDMNRDSFDDMQVKLNSIKDFKAYIKITKLAGALLIPKRNCLENWVCADWSTCYSDGVQIRNCLDRNECNTIYDQPAEKRSCYYVAGQQATVDLSGITDYLGSTQSDIRLAAYIILFASIISLISISVSFYSSRNNRGLLALARHPKAGIRSLELREEKLEKMIAMLDHAYNDGSIDKNTRNMEKKRLETRLRKIRQKIGET